MKGRELQKDTALNKKVQAIEDDLMKLQEGAEGHGQQDQTLMKLVKEVREIQQSPLWHEMQVTAAE